MRRKKRLWAVVFLGLAVWGGWRLFGRRRGAAEPPPAMVTRAERPPVRRKEAPRPQAAPRPAAVPAWKRVLLAAQRRLAAGEVGAALRELGRRYRASTDPEARKGWRPTLLRWAARYVLRPSAASGLYERYTVAPGDSLIRIARKLRQTKRILVAPTFLAELNGIRDPRRLRAGARIWVPRVSPYLEVRLEEFGLDHYLGDCLAAWYPVGIGREGRETPRVEFAVGAKLKEPTWYHPEKGEVPYGDPENELGERWIGFQHPEWRGYGIHGTNDERTVGKAVSRGCIRMHNRDVIQLFDRVPLGCKVRVRG